MSHCAHNRVVHERNESAGGTVYGESWRCDGCGTYFAPRPTSKLPSAPSPAEETVWICAKCGYGGAEHGMEGHPAYKCVADMRLVAARRALPEPVSTEGAACPRCKGTRQIERIELTPGGHPMHVTDECPMCAKPSAEGDGWIAEPNEQGWWWHINVGEQADMIPFMYCIMRSGTNGKMFTQHPDSRWCWAIGGLWAKATPPALPAPPSGQGEKR